MSGWMELKHRRLLRQHQAQVKVFALIFILFYVSTQIFGLLINLHHLWYHTSSSWQCQHQPIRKYFSNQGHQQTRQETSRMSGQMRLKHRRQLRQHRAQVKVFALVFILCHVASCQPKYKDSLLMCWVLRKDNECAKFQNKVFHYRIYIINTEKLTKSADTCKQINIKPV